MCSCFPAECAALWVHGLRLFQGFVKARPILPLCSATWTSRLWSRPWTLSLSLSSVLCSGCLSAARVRFLYVRARDFDAFSCGGPSIYLGVEQLSAGSRVGTQGTNKKTCGRWTIAVMIPVAPRKVQQCLATRHAQQETGSVRPHSPVTKDLLFFARRSSGSGAVPSPVTRIDTNPFHVLLLRGPAPSTLFSRARAVVALLSIPADTIVLLTNGPNHWQRELQRQSAPTRRCVISIWEQS